MDQLKPSKWPLRMRSPMGDGALRGRPSAALIVAERWGLSRPNGRLFWVGLTAVFGGAFGGERARLPISGFKAVLSESRRMTPVPRSL